ncbi:hypothetical protein ABAC402_01460 [Asticcacaulis sp. AC402]|nr:hypothetical protein ABAC402_01460 [Asticcacaulis sp. AC402]
MIGIIRKLFACMGKMIIVRYFDTYVKKIR